MRNTTNNPVAMGNHDRLDQVIEEAPPIRLQKRHVELSGELKNKGLANGFFALKSHH